MIARSQSDAVEVRRGEFVLSTDRERLDLDVIHGFLTDCYWAKGIPREVVARSIENSLCFGIYAKEQQIAFARVISDFATYAYIADVFVLMVKTTSRPKKSTSRWFWTQSRMHRAET
jgi:hypothetical protein